MAQGSGMHNKFIIGDAEYTESAFVLTGSTTSPRATWSRTSTT